MWVQEGGWCEVPVRHTQGHVAPIYWCTLCEKSMKSMEHIKLKHTDHSLGKSLDERREESQYCWMECEKKFLKKKNSGLPN